LAAAAAIMLFVGLGILKEMKGDPRMIADIIPVDSVVATIIVASAYNFRQTNLSIYHAASSDRNPITWHEVKEKCAEYWNAS